MTQTIVRPCASNEDESNTHRCQHQTWKHSLPKETHNEYEQRNTIRYGQSVLHEAQGNCCGLLRRALNLGRESRKVRELPVFPRLKEAPPRKGFLENHRAIVNALPELWFRAIVECGRTYGWRVAELQNLRVRQVDLFARTIRLDAGETKNDEGRLAVMTDAVYTLLLECVRGKKPDDYVFTRTNGKRVADFRVTWRKACVAAGVGKWLCLGCEPEQVLDAKGHCAGCGQAWKPREWKYCGAIFHDWRRTAVRDMVRHGVPERVAMAISGHKTRSVFDRYNIVSESDLREAARRMEAVNRYELATFEPKPTPVANTRTLN